MTADAKLAITGSRRRLSFARLALGTLGVLVLAVVAVGLNAFGYFERKPPKRYAPPEVPAARLTPDQYRALISDTFGAHVDLGGRFEPGLRVAGLLTVGASSVSVTAAGMEQYDSMADAIAEQVLMDPANRAALMPCRPAAPAAPDDACAGRFLESAGLLLFRRALAPEELSGYVAAARAATETLGDFHGGLALALSAMLSSPQFLFRLPNIEPDPERAGGYRLDGWSKASRLSFFLWNAGPDRHLLDAAAAGELDSMDGIERQVERMMASPRLEQGLRAFLADMFQFDRFEALSKDPTIFPKFGRREMTDAQEQTLRTLVDLLLVQQGDYRDAFTTRRTWLTPSLAAIYRVPLPHEGPNGAAEQWAAFEFPADDPRGGILAHVSFTALHSPAGRTSPTDRGKALREIMMCQTVPAPPPDVAFTEVQNVDDPVNKTVRTRLLAHATVPACAGCHKIMDPIGLALENFDGSGEYRIVENGSPIDTSGELDGVAFADPRGLAQAVRNNPAIPSCLVQRLAAYALGQPIGSGQQNLVRRLQDQFAEDGYRVPALMRRIATSPEFYQAAAPAAAITAALQ